MNLSRYQLLSQLGAGKDGVAYAARDTESGDSVEVRDLTRCRNHARRWARAATLLQRIRILEDPSCRKLVDSELEGEAPFVVLPAAAARTLADVLGGSMPEPAVRTRWVLDLSRLLASAHRLGITHGQLCPSQIRIDEPGHPVVDFSHFLGLAAGTVESCVELDAVCRPEATADAFALDPAANDIFALGAVAALLYGCPPADLSAGTIVPGFDGPLRELVAAMLAADPFDRPLAESVAEELRAICGGSDTAPLEQQTINTDVDLSSYQANFPDETIPLVETRSSSPALRDQVAQLEGRRLGRFELQQQLGSGATGAVYRAIDRSAGSVVAVKVLHAKHSGNPEALKRFRREAQILSGIENPHVARVLEVNEADGLHYLAMEYIEGRSLADVLADRGPLDPQQSLTILADVARALVEPHQRGVIHRDVKPDNIIVRDLPLPARSLTDDSAQGLATDLSTAAATLVDFGLARQLFESEDATAGQVAAIVGTPAYMSPEQASGLQVGPETDVYAMGATLFHATAGRPPFVDADLQGLLDQHRHKSPPRVTEFQTAAASDLEALVERMLAKLPAERQADAGALLDDIHRLRRGEPIDIDLHPIAPEDGDGVLEYAFEWELKSPRAALWPFVSNTERLNEAIGLPAVDYSTEVAADGSVRQMAATDRLGMRFEWHEHPFEWIEGRRLSVLREFQNGPLKWFINVVELKPLDSGGTLLSHQVFVQPRSVLGRAAAALEVGVNTRRMLGRVYRHIDQSLTASSNSDAFQNPIRLRAARRRRLDDLLVQLKQDGQDPTTVDRLGQHVSQAPAQEISRIRPLAFASRCQLDPEAVVETCLAAAQRGLLVLLWDILCPLNKHHSM